MSMSKPTIDADLMQISAEVRELRRRLFVYMTMREKERYTALMARMAQLSRVIKQREQEHTEGER
jgi:hypothetical protein